MAAYYNENDPFAAQWLRNLIAEKLIAPGDVDERSIEDVRPNDLMGYTQCHFFAGIGGWSYALRLAGWPDDRSVWTGSCPCQPFSAAGKRAGFADERHLWPSFFHLIQEQKPAVIFGEQTQEAVDWLDLVQTDLEGIDYSCAAVIAPAASVGAPHIRHRIFWMADTESKRGRWGTEVENGRLSQLGRPSERVSSFPWPDHRGNSSLLTFSEVCEPSYGVPSRVGKLRGLGNAIVPQLAAEFIRAYTTC